MTSELLSTLPVERLGRVLVHFVWQGALVAALLALLLYALRRHAASLRYAAALSALLVMAALPVATWAVLTPAAVPLAEAPSAAPSLPALALGESARVVAAPEPSRWAQAQSLFDSALPWLVAGWLLGVAVLSVRLAGGWAAAQRLRWRGTRLIGAAWTQRFEGLAQRLGVPEAARLVVSTAVEGPMTLGWWRPVVLVPAGVLTGLPPEQVEAILAHELAHIRRHDYLVGLAQSAVETLLFYHPAVWWVSRRVRVLREHCCDDLAAAACADRLTYARALTALEGWRPGPRVALSATGGSLGERVRRLVGMPQASERRRPVVLLMLLFVAAACAVGGQGWAAETSERPERAPLQTMLTVPADTTEPDSARVRIFFQPDSLRRSLRLFADSISGAWAFDVEEGPDLDSLVAFSLHRADSALQRVDWKALQEKLQEKIAFDLDSLVWRNQSMSDSALQSIDWPDVQAEMQREQNEALRAVQRWQQQRDTLNLDSLLQRYHTSVLERLLRQEDRMEAQEEARQASGEARAEARRALEEALREARQAQEETRWALNEAQTEALERAAGRLEGRADALELQAEALDEQGNAEVARALREESRRLREQRAALREQGGPEAQGSQLRERREALKREILELKRQSRALKREAGRLERERDALREEEAEPK